MIFNFAMLEKKSL